MLQMLTTEPEFLIRNVDVSFRNVKVSSYLTEALRVLPAFNVQIMHPEEITAADYPKGVLIKTPFGKTTLEHIPSGLMAYLMAYSCKVANKPFCCLEFVIGGNLYKLFEDLAADTNLIYVLSESGIFSSGTPDGTRIKYLLNGKEEQA